MKIEKITKLKGDKYLVIIDNKKHIIYSDVLLAFNIYKPIEISKDIYDKIKIENDLYVGYSKVLSFINFKMRSQKEVYKKLNDLNIDKDSSKKIISKLKSQGYLNDDKYVTCFINDSINLTLNGPKKIILELKKKGIDEEKTKEVLLSVDSNIWVEKALKIANKKQRSYKNMSSLKFKQKLRQDLINMGYDERYFSDILSDIDIDDNEAYLKEKEKITNKLSRKYEGEKLEYMVKQKLYALGYRK